MVCLYIKMGRIPEFSSDMNELTAMAHSKSAHRPWRAY